MIVNKTKNKILAHEHTVYRGILQAKGLMFSGKKAAVFPFSVPRKVSLHTLFVFYPIDILLLDSKFKVLEIKEKLEPFAFFTSKNKANYVIELPNQVGKSVSIGDVITFSQ